MLALNLLVLVCDSCVVAVAGQEHLRFDARHQQDRGPLTTISAHAIPQVNACQARNVVFPATVTGTATSYTPGSNAVQSETEMNLFLMLACVASRQSNSYPPRHCLFELSDRRKQCKPTET